VVADAAVARWLETLKRLMNTERGEKDLEELRALVTQLHKMINWKLIDQVCMRHGRM
jgi:hypothetical protein